MCKGHGSLRFWVWLLLVFGAVLVLISVVVVVLALADPDFVAESPLATPLIPALGVLVLALGAIASAVVRMGEMLDEALTLLRRIAGSTDEGGDSGTPA